MRTAKQIIWFPAIIFFLITLVSHAQLEPCNFLCNMDFEKPGLPAGTFTFFNQSKVPCWKTTATDQAIEIWGSGFGGVPAYSGKNFAELNATQVSTLYQDFKAPMGETVIISFAHRGRAGTDVMSVSIGPVGGPYVVLGNFSATKNAWVYNKINYTFPSGGTQNYSIRFNSVSAAGGATVGNFLDAISITLPPPKLKITQKNPICGNQKNGSILVSVIGGTSPYQYKWDSPVQSVDSIANNLFPGNYVITVTDYYGCLATQQITLVADNKPITYGINKNLCLGETFITRTGKIVNQQGVYLDTIKSSFCDSIYIQNVSIRNTIMQKVDISICDGEQYIMNNISYAKSGDYKDTIALPGGCDSIIDLNLFVLPAKSNKIKKEICNGETFNFHGQSYSQSGSYSKMLSSFQGCDSLVTLDLFVNKSFLFSINKSICQGEVHTIGGQSFDKTGSFQIKMLSVRGCDSIINLNLLVKNIQANFQTQYSGECAPLTVLFNNTTNQPGLFATWDFGNGFFAKGDQVSTNYSKSGNYSVTLLVADSNGCKSVITRNDYIMVKKSPAADFIIPKTLSESNTDIKIKDASSDAIKWNYFISDGYEYSIPEFSHSFTQPGMYEIMQVVANSDNCTDTIVKTIEVKHTSKLYVPNCFSPNENNINNVFRAYGIFFEDFQMRIFNRWGEELFQTREIESGWNGYYQGKLCPSDVYVYKITYKDHLNMFKTIIGRVTLLN